MVFDYTRSIDKLTLTAEQLEKYYQCTFFPITDLILIGLESRYRASDIPEEILSAASLTANSAFEEVQTNPTVENWFQDKLGQSKNELLVLQKQLQDSPERLTYRVCNSLIKSMLKMIDE